MSKNKSQLNFNDSIFKFYSLEIDNFEICLKFEYWYLLFQKNDNLATKGVSGLN